MSQQREYNHVYTFRRFIVQVMLHGQDEGIHVDVLPQVELAINNRCLIVGVGLGWICGYLNFGIMQAAFRDREVTRNKEVESNAAKLGITKRQMELRWGW